MHTQHIERLWGSVKWRNKKERGTKRDFIDTYLAEFMCRKCIMGDTPFEWLMNEIALQFTPAINIDPGSKSDEDEERNQDIEEHIDENGRESDEEYGDVAEYDKEFDFMWPIT